ncbi:MAG: DUF4105 domain-containing protein [Oligoflexus sp.]|nr:DUF4105 domain-containing protein [Oligoflexus sp.]
MTRGLLAHLCRMLIGGYFLSFFLTVPVQAQEAETINSLANDMDQVDIYLHTIDVGHMVYDNFGHTAIRVVDHRKYSDMVYNWGTFSFDDGPVTFAFNFYKGHLTYTLSVYPFANAMRIYKYDSRTVWEDKLTLTPAQKETLLKRLEWNARPENRGYSYQYFFDNCSTRPRNYIDEALGGVLKEQYSEVISNKTFRDFVMDGYESNPGMDVLLDFGMNSNLDRFATAWETMFHPLYLRSVLLEYSKDKSPLLTGGHTLVEHPRPDAYPKLAYSFMLIFGGVPLIPLVFGLFFQQKKAEPSRLLYRSFGALASLWLGFGALWGFVMALSWAISDHLDLHHNANQLLFWPIDVFAFILALMIFIKARPLKLSPVAWNFARAYLLVHIIVSILMPCLRAFGVIEQNVNRVSVFLLPPYVAILLMIFRVGIRREENKPRIEA